MKISREVLEKEIFNRKQLPRWSTECIPQSYRLACTLRNENYDISDFTHYFRLYEEIIGDKQTTVSSVSSRILIWAFGLDGRYSQNSRSDRSGWSDLFQRSEELIKQMEEEGLLYTQMILHESLAHRYGDILIDDGLHQHEVEHHYEKSHEIAKLLARSKHVDSSMYYAFRVWARTGEIDRALKCCLRVFHNPNRYIPPRYEVGHLVKCQRCIDFLKEYGLSWADLNLPDDARGRDPTRTWDIHTFY